MIGVPIFITAQELVDTPAELLRTRLMAVAMGMGVVVQHAQPANLPKKGQTDGA